MFKGVGKTYFWLKVGKVVVGEVGVGKVVVGVGEVVVGKVVVGKVGVGKVVVGKVVVGKVVVGKHKISQTAHFTFNILPRSILSPLTFTFVTRHLHAPALFWKTGNKIATSQASSCITDSKYTQVTQFTAKVISCLVCAVVSCKYLPLPPPT